jgi:hypothetical protein
MTNTIILFENKWVLYNRLKV